MTDLRTERRHAEVGERIVITKPQGIVGVFYRRIYDTDDILTVKEVRHNGSVYTEEHGIMSFIGIEEYEVLTQGAN